jgi:hypothetical protein
MDDMPGFYPVQYKIWTQLLFSDLTVGVATPACHLRVRVRGGLVAGIAAPSIRPG